MQMEMQLETELEETLTTEEVAKRLGVRVASINRWLKAGHFPNAWRINPYNQSRWRIPKSDVDAFIEKRTRQRGYFYIPDTIPHRKIKLAGFSGILNTCSIFAAGNF